MLLWEQKIQHSVHNFQLIFISTIQRKFDDDYVIRLFAIHITLNLNDTERKIKQKRRNFADKKLCHKILIMRFDENFITFLYTSAVSAKKEKRPKALKS